jgi:DivIVA domain-containing protein
MMWLFSILAALVLGGVAVVAAGRAGTLPDVERTSGLDALPVGALGAGELRTVRFPLALRGYRMRDVDALLDRLARQLEEAEPVQEEAVSTRSENETA